MKKRIWSVVLCLCMVVAMFQSLAIPAMAYSTGDTYPSEYKNAVADSVIDRWNFYNRECTSFAAWCLNDRNGVNFTNWYGGIRWGHAKDWGTAARNLGITVDMAPAVGAVAWWNSGTYGHVAWVSAVNGDSVTIEEYNYGYAYAWHTRTISRTSVSGYIHIKDIGGASEPSVSFTQWNKDGYTYIYETDASLGQLITVSNGNCTDTGMFLYDASGNKIGEANNGGYSSSVPQIYFKINEECHYTLTKGTTYKYKFYAIVNGTTYWSQMYSFKTNGSFQITANASLSNGGTATGGGSYENGQSVTVRATPNTGYRFVRWTENGSTVSTSASHAFTVSKDQTLVAVFEKDEPITVTVTVVPTASAITYGQTLMDSKLTGGTVTGSDSKTISGSWLWTAPSTKPAASDKFEALFTPSTAEDVAKYGLTSAQVTVTVNKAKLRLTAPTATPIKSGQKLSESTLTSGSAVDSSGNTVSGTWAWQTPNAIPNVGTQTYQAVFTPSIGEAYNVGTVSVSVTVAEEGLPCSNGHTWETWTVSIAPTCTQAGQWVRCCTRCGEQETETVAALGHSYRPSGTTSVCTRCGNTLNSETSGALDNFKQQHTYYDGLFSDVSSGAWYVGNVASAYQYGLMYGRAANRFVPENNVTLAETITLAARIHSIYYYGTEKFEVYDGGNWYDPYVDYARTHNICTENYSYNTPATREEFVHILASALPETELIKIPGNNLSFADAVSIVYKGDVEYLCGAGIINGINENGMMYFKPNKTISRAEAAAIITRMVQPDLRS